MICLIAGNYFEAKNFAYSQNWRQDEWFFPTDDKDLLERCDFHVLVIGTAGQNIPASWFERFYQLALQRGRTKKDISRVN